ncbi:MULTISPECIES: bifunctional folylpolyglutamate synthase/dihydrofolate synthase [Lactococcus]|uniref:bifunctional folylpolyglutamate synthase/dihydrofolate synthase n=1 Tax=Lactococcus TaxID=1357 RepID=UPI0002E0AB16|nr:MULTISPECIES: folylpolyglutamate synthase/dihydrofolate synthase family protein [Lactococcus]KKF90796.1 tetrahydrofolate synthase [Lactococcus garvieae]MDG6137068.1 bifunctional folylpolyglutamate synthase/dihydrofolate synthase [Lactococcus petauri]MDT2552461.1 bifunctional folylpolyglutamate synthase/dihydrofolate synthase [Lactococcus petauri]MDT2563057.1 bifunctional folylpolyglutamate synthase/dihydrofolate synthase [Lactococcus petauri]MDT2575698.1 bifunctional folylpolyglutamate synt
MTIETALEWIHSRLKFNIRPGLTRIEALLKLLENPEKELSMLHIAGTNGKGSTVAFTRGILEQLGLTVATFTSPFIETFGERMAINGHPIPDEKLIKYVGQLKPLVEEMDKDARLAGITEFEIITALAFRYFADEHVDVALIEVGLGGLLDSTNVIQPVATAITTIGMDHMDILGDTLEKIAAQKAGIIKPYTPLVTGKIADEALGVIAETAQTNQAKHYQYGIDYQVEILENERFNYKDDEIHLLNLEKSLLGLHQIDNAALAVKLTMVYAHKVGLSLSEEAIRVGLRRTFWPARMEEVSQAPLTLLDGAHNVHAMQRLLENLKNEFSGRKITILFSALVTKDITEMIKMLQTVDNSKLILTTFDYPKALKLEDFAYLEKENVTLAEDWKSTYAALKENLHEDDVLLMTGSLYFMSQIRAYILASEQ